MSKDKKSKPKLSVKPRAKPRAKKEPVMITCEVCRGTGLKFEVFEQRQFATEMCPVCEGSGKVEK